jgi:hypothetical protein
VKIPGSVNLTEVAFKSREIDLVDRFGIRREEPYMDARAFWPFPDFDGAISSVEGPVISSSRLGPSGCSREGGELKFPNQPESFPDAGFVQGYSPADNRDLVLSATRSVSGTDVMICCCSQTFRSLAAGCVIGLKMSARSKLYSM